MRAGRRPGRAARACETPLALVRTSGASTDTGGVPRCATTDRAATTSPEASRIGAATETASAVTCRSLTA